MKIRRMRTVDDGFEPALADLLRWDAREDAAVTRTAQEIIDRVRAEGDAAVLDLTRQHDRVAVSTITDLVVSKAQLQQAFDDLGEDDRESLVAAAGRIRTYHEAQLDSGFEMTDALGNRLGQRVMPLDRVGVYVPGGQAAYPSTVLMTVVPARVAGVGEVVVTVPTPDGVRNPHVLAAMHVAQVDTVFTIGGAQAIAAMAWGTQAVPRVDKIVGPGGAYVAAAKRLVFGPVGIDVIAGPSEVLIVADGSVPPRWTALDLFSQAEHDAAAQSILLSPQSDYLDAVEAEMGELLDGMARRTIIEESLANRGAFVQTRDLDEAIDVANRVAPEHLQLAVREPRSLLERVRHAGAIFLGGLSAEVMGDYSAGPSHVLPTFGTARYASPLGVYDFTKRSSVIECSPAGADALARVAARIADAEGLGAHAAAARVRVTGFDHNDESR